MIRKIIIVVLTLGAVGVVALQLIALYGWPVIYSHHGLEVSVRGAHFWVWLRDCPGGPWSMPFWLPFEVQFSGGRLWCAYIALWLLFVLFAIYPAIAFIAGPVRRWRRHRKGLCVKCGYNLTGNLSGVCPECGTPRAEISEKRLS